MYPNFKILPKETKADLKAKIAESIALEKKRTRRKKLYVFSSSAAAVFCLFFGLVTIFKQKSQSVEINAIEEFAKNTANEGSFEKSNKVQLVLSNQEAVTVGDSTTIAYDASGNKINVNNKQIQQEISKKSQYNTVLVPYGKRAQLSLADGTQVWLNSGSKLIYPTSFDAETREVFLEGEGIFDVSHNVTKPFFVRAANNYSVRVLGTLFNVSCYAKDAKVSTALLRGKVKVAYAKKGFFKTDSIQTILKPGMIASLDKKRETIKTIAQDVEPLFSWRKGYYEFSEERLPSVLEKLTRYYNVDFVLNKKISPNETYSGAFKLNDDLDKVVETLEATTGFEFVYNEAAREITIN
ncbi:FecR family protein [Flavobacterium ajazii]|uniref:FecR family protein n=1 Tax=Flavobacterium ajazii TaxID=2692318 RepID=UPI0013CF594B|nr:FecR domain-containing protein [Flavobacterium ajazii]